MVLSDSQIVSYIENPQNGALIKYIYEEKKKHELHIVGYGLEEFIETVDKVENPDYIKVKKKLANLFTVKTYEKVLRSKDKIITARGGTILYEFDNDKDKKKESVLKELLESVDDSGRSLKTYTENIWLDYGIWVDPMGITLIERESSENDEGEIELEENYKLTYLSVYKRNERGKPERLYHDFDFKSFNRIEYLILYLGDDQEGNKIYRVIDDEKDEFWIEIKNKDVTDIRRIEGSTIEHDFIRCPALFNSNKLDKANLKSFQSYCKESMIIADDLLNDYIDFRIYKKKLGIPRYWELKSKCLHCNDGYVQITDVNSQLYKDGQKTAKCSVCGGSGYNPRERTLTDVMLLDLLETDTQSNVPPFGTVTLPTDIQELFWSELQQMEMDLNETVWGVGTSVDKERKNTTAFEISVRNEGKMDKLRAIEVNKVEWQTTIINLIGDAVYKNDFKGVVKTPSNQFLMLTPTETRQVYLESKKAESSEEQLTKLWLDYIYAEYETNPVEQTKQEKIMLLTPMFHSDIISAWDYLNEDERLIKKNLENYILRYEKEGGSLLIDPIEDITKKFLEYNKILKNDTSIQQENEE
jgi:hypothetical protein